MTLHFLLVISAVSAVTVREMLNYPWPDFIDCQTSAQFRSLRLDETESHLLDPTNRRVKYIPVKAGSLYLVGKAEGNVLSPPDIRIWSPKSASTLYFGDAGIDGFQLPTNKEAFTIDDHSKLHLFQSNYVQLRGSRCDISHFSRVTIRNSRLTLSKNSVFKVEQSFVDFWTSSVFVGDSADFAVDRHSSVTFDHSYGPRPPLIELPAVTMHSAARFLVDQQSSVRIQSEFHASLNSDSKLILKVLSNLSLGQLDATGARRTGQFVLLNFTTVELTKSTFQIENCLKVFVASKLTVELKASTVELKSSEDCSKDAEATITCVIYKDLKLQDKTYRVPLTRPKKPYVPEIGEMVCGESLDSLLHSELLQLSDAEKIRLSDSDRRLRREMKFHADDISNGDSREKTQKCPTQERDLYREKVEKVQRCKATELKVTLVLLLSLVFQRFVFML